MADVVDEAFRAVRDDDEKRLMRILKSVSLSQVPAPGFGGWLHYAANIGSIRVVKALIEIGEDVTQRDDLDGLQPLTSAAAGGRVDVVELLLEQGVTPDLSTAARNPLFAAVSSFVQSNPLWSQEGKAPMRTLSALVCHGIDVTKRYKIGKTKGLDVIAYAVLIGARDAAHFLVDHMSGGSEETANLLIREAEQLAGRSVLPVPPGEDVRPS